MMLQSVPSLLTETDASQQSPWNPDYHEFANKLTRTIVIATNFSLLLTLLSQLHHVYTLHL